MSTCHKCGRKLITVPVPDYPGKTIEICKPCNKKLSDSLFSGFTLAQVRHAHMSALNPPLEIQITLLPTGYWHIRGHGICNWIQVPEWPCNEGMIRQYAFDEASEEFIKEVVRRSNLWVMSTILDEYRGES